jgi:hypothetical protein
MKELTAKEAIESVTAKEFKRNNGIVVRAAALGKPRSWFDLNDLRDIINNRMSDEDIIKCLFYLTDEGYFKVRHCETNAAVDIADFDIEDLEFRLSSKGTRLFECIEKDDLILL